MARPSPRSIKRLLIANRGEIATRIISTARELDIKTIAIYVKGDTSHTIRASQAIEVPSAAIFMNISALIELVKKHNIDAVHPGYGFLSESDEFAKRMWDEAGVLVVGPGWTILRATGEKLRARELADRYQVPVAPALREPTNNVEQIQHFADEIGYPIMIKAVDGGGGRGIRLVRSADQLASSVKRAVEESPSKQVFAEKASVDGFRHVEVQIIGDGTGNVTHLWERECSIQRRFQKIVESAPSVVADRPLIAEVIRSALRMAEHIKYFSLGTFEFLVNPTSREYYFLEVNPRLQVEHTITESISMTDIVKAQLLLSQGALLAECGLPLTERQPDNPPPAHSIQLRITAENVDSNWSLSIGKITSFQFPAGNGVRVDTHLITGHPSIVSADFDSLIAKVIVTSSSWKDTVRKAQRVLDDTRISGVKTNLDMLRAIVAHPDFSAGQCDTQWLESKQAELLHQSKNLSTQETVLGETREFATEFTPTISTANTLFRRGDAWAFTLSPTSKKPNTQSLPHHLALTRVLRNDFPNSFSAELLFTKPSATAGGASTSTPYTINIAATSSSAAAATSHHRRANPSDASHISIPFAGKLVEVLVDEGDLVKESDVICVVQQMKMELEVRSPRSGKVTWVTEAEDGEDMAEGTLAAIIESEKEARL